MSNRTALKTKGRPDRLILTGPNNNQLAKKGSSDMEMDHIIVKECQKVVDGELPPLDHMDPELAYRIGCLSGVIARMEKEEPRDETKLAEARSALRTSILLAKAEWYDDVLII